MRNKKKRKKVITKQMFQEREKYKMCQEKIKYREKEKKTLKIQKENITVLKEK